MLSLAADLTDVISVLESKSKAKREWIKERVEALVNQKKAELGKAESYRQKKSSKQTQILPAERIMLRSSMKELHDFSKNLLRIQGHSETRKNDRFLYVDEYDPTSRIPVSKTITQDSPEKLNRSGSLTHRRIQRPILRASMMSIEDIAQKMYDRIPSNSILIQTRKNQKIMEKLQGHSKNQAVNTGILDYYKDQINTKNQKARRAASKNKLQTNPGSPPQASKEIVKETSSQEHSPSAPGKSLLGSGTVYHQNKKSELLNLLTVSQNRPPVESALKKEDVKCQDNPGMIDESSYMVSKESPLKRSRSLTHYRGKPQCLIHQSTFQTFEIEEGNSGLSTHIASILKKMDVSNDETVANNDTSPPKRGNIKEILSKHFLLNPSLLWKDIFLNTKRY